MEKPDVKLLLESLIDRIYRDPTTNKWRLDGPISDIEYKALGGALALLDSGSVVSAIVPPQSPSKPSRPKCQPVLNAKREKIEQEAVVLCLDFGTAMSKAYATLRDAAGKDHDVPILLGKAAGEPSPFLLSSSVWIEDDGTILVGRRAVERGMAAQRRRRRRVDSLKQQLSQGDVHDLKGALLDSAFNPSEVEIHYGDLISFYLGYLTDLAEGELERLGHSRFVRRRFALPCWNPPRNKLGEELIRSHLARAQILADTFRGRWEGGVKAAELRDVIDVLNPTRDTWPYALVGEGVLEPIAAGASRLENEEEFARHLVMIVDVGAGTTDFALFVARETGEGAMKFFPVAGCADAIRQAGDLIDDKLRKLILRLASVDEGSDQYQWVNDDLLQTIRGYKEALFDAKRLNYRLSNDAAGEVTLDGLLAEQGVQDFGAQLSAKFQEVLERGRAAVDAGQYESIKVVLTGGGAQLPMVKTLAYGQVRCGGTVLRREEAALLPPSWRERPPEIRRIYPQLAVAVGGAQKDLPTVSQPIMPKGSPIPKVAKIPSFTD
jgi:hypothetical protein